MAERVAVLLGAGASRDAGLPLSGQLTRYLIETIATRDLELSAVLNQICSAIIAHQGARGVSPLEDFNVERVISSIRLLRGRENHEAAPFVSSWLPALEAAGNDSGVSAATARAIVDQLGLGNMTPFPGRLENALTDAVREVVGGNNSGEIYARLEDACVQAIADRLSEIDDVSYMRPLVDLARSQGSLDIATLNYDLTVEQVCEENAEPLCRGLSTGWPKVPLSWDDLGISLYKIHGSIDWWQDAPRNTHWFTSPDYIGADQISVSREGNRFSRPAMVLGDREKLESQPVTLAMLSSFEKALDQATRLLICGYSFADAHINTVVGNWLGQDEQRQVTVLSTDDFFSKRQTAFAEQLKKLTYDGEVTTVPRVNGISATAKDGFERALASPPVPLDDIAISISTSQNDGRTLIFVTNGTADPIRGLRASGSAGNHDSPAATTVSLSDLDPDSRYGGAINIRTDKVLLPGDTWTLEVTPHSDDLSSASVQITAQLPIGSTERIVQLGI